RRHTRFARDWSSDVCSSDLRWLVLVRDNGSLFAVTRIILHALFWGVTLTILPGIVGWHLLRRRPLRRIRAIQASAEAIVAGDLKIGRASCRERVECAQEPAA